jgi:hypothetical protein
VDAAVIGYVHPDHVRAEFMQSMLALTRRRHDAGLRDGIITVHSGPFIAAARNEICARFLTEQAAAWLWMVDTDMVFAPDTLCRLLDAADPTARPIVGALCFSQGDNNEALPTMYELVPQDGAAAFARYQVWPEDQPVPVGGTGAACLLVHRDALFTIADGVNGKRDRVWPWFRETTMGRRRVGEDLTFCLRAGMCGVPVHVHTGVQVGHMKSTMLGKVV